MFHYAQLNENGICIAVSTLAGEVTADNLIRLDTYDTDKLWRKYENGQWSAGKYEPISTAPIDEFEETKQRVADLEMAMAAVLGGAI